MRTLHTTLRQIFCKIIFNSKVIVKYIIDPDDNSIHGLNSQKRSSGCDRCRRAVLMYV